MTKRLAIYLTNTERSGWDKPYANYAAMIAELLAPLLPNYVIELFDAVTGKLPPVPEDYDGVVLTGSIANVTEQEPWMAELYEHIRRLDKARVKLVGICFGHQAIVHALGGLVGVAEPQVGCRTMVLQEQAYWMHPWQENISLYCGNSQQVQVLGCWLVRNSALCHYMPRASIFWGVNITLNSIANMLSYTCNG